MRLRLTEPQAHDQQIKEIRSKGTMKEGWEEVEEVLYFQGLLYVPEIIRTELINRHDNNPLAGYFGIEKTQELVAQKYY